MEICRKKGLGLKGREVIAGKSDTGTKKCFCFGLVCFFLCCYSEHNKCASAELFLLTEFSLVTDLALTLLSNPD